MMRNRPALFCHKHTNTRLGFGYAGLGYIHPEPYYCHLCEEEQNKDLDIANRVQAIKDKYCKPTNEQNR